MGKEEEIKRLVRDLKTNLYSIRATKVSKYWKGVGRNVEEAINLVETLEKELGGEEK
ncbi:hypothetical protein [Thermococcus paralvinellae]|uniref:hypothetical protein n=1 Tax=Thermococcus paralvinellae TaxID=582419 RepID=UPI000ADCAACA|nr:hypothetical protein [Thermococcus paralvinellae]